MFRFNLDHETDKRNGYDGEVNQQENHLLHPENHLAQALLGNRHTSVQMQASNDSSASQNIIANSLPTASSLL